MTGVDNALKRISKDTKDGKNKSTLKKILIPLGAAAGLAAGILGAKKLFVKPKWNPGQREAVVGNIEEMIMKRLKKRGVGLN